MCSDILNVVEFGDHIKLRQDGQCFQPYGESPEYPIDCEFAMKQDAQEDSDDVEINVREGIRLIVIALWLGMGNTNLYGLLILIR